LVRTDRLDCNDLLLRMPEAERAERAVRPIDRPQVPATLPRKERGGILRALPLARPALGLAQLVRPLVCNL